MRTLLGIAVGCWLAVGLGLVRADEGARAVIDKAIKAAGGEEKLAKYQAQTWSEKGTFYGMGDGIAYTGKYATQWPDKFRMEIENYMTLVIDGERGWMKTADTQDIPKEQMEEQREGRYAAWVATLVPLKDKGFTLRALDKAKVTDKPAAGVQVSHAGHRDVKLYFDKGSGQLVKVEQRVKALEEGGKEVTQETLFSDYHEVQGVRVPGKIMILRDGKKYLEAEERDVKLFEKLDGKEFSKP